MIPLGIVAAAAAGVLPSDYELISTTYVTGTTTSSVTFSSIPTTYRHLELRISARSLTAAVNTQLFIRINGATGTSYWHHKIEVKGSDLPSVSANNLNSTSLAITPIPAASNDADIFAAWVVQIPDYQSTTKHKTVKAVGGYASSVFRDVELNSGIWQNTAAVSSLTLFVSTSALAANSRISLYGIKG